MMLGFRPLWYCGKLCKYDLVQKHEKSSIRKVRAHLHTTDDHARYHLASVAHYHVLSSVHVKGGHAWSIVNHAQPGQPLHTYTHNYHALRYTQINSGAITKGFHWHAGMINILQLMHCLHVAHKRSKKTRCAPDQLPFANDISCKSAIYDTVGMQTSWQQMDKAQPKSPRCSVYAVLELACAAQFCDNIVLGCKTALLNRPAGLVLTMT